MTMNVRTLSFTLLGLALAGLVAAWLVSATEWDTRDVWEPPTGEAARDPHFLLKRLATRLGAQVEVRHQLNQLPPEGGTLLLETINWRFMPEHEAALRAWVTRGGHLVAYQELVGPVGGRAAVNEWLPVTFERVKRPSASGTAPDAAASAASAASSGTGVRSVYVDQDDDEDSEDWDATEEEEEKAEAAGEAPPASVPTSAPTSSTTSDPQPAPPAHPPSPSPAPAVASGAKQRPPCLGLSEPAHRPGWFGAPRKYETCARSAMVLKTDLQPLWSVEDDKGLRAARLPLGQGTFTLSTQWESPRGATLQDDDEALLMAAMLQLRPGQQIWILDDTRHPGLLATLWRVAPAACALAALALLLVLWRWSIRFAPLRAPDTLARRSITSQVRGTAAYLLRHGPAALHRAQRRALEEAALAHVPGWRRLGAEERIALLARHAGLPPAELAHACDPATPGDPRTVGRALGLMEAARRRIVELGLLSSGPAADAAATTTTPPPHATPPHSPPHSPPSA